LKRYEIGCKLLLIINRKLHTGFRLVPTLVTLNDLERRNCLYCALFHLCDVALEADYVTVVEDRPIMSAKYRLPVIFAKTDRRSIRTVSVRQLSFLHKCCWNVMLILCILMRLNGLETTISDTVLYVLYGILRPWSVTSLRLVWSSSL